MLDIKFIRQNPEKVKEACEKKQVKIDMNRVLELDKKKGGLMTDLERIKAEQNKISRGSHNELAISKAKELKEQFKKLEPEFKKVEDELNGLLILLPNIPFDDVPVGKDESENVVLRKVGKPKKFNFAIKDYMQLGKDLDLIDIERAGKVSGSRSGYLKRELPLLEFAIINFVMDIVRKEGFIPVIPPILLKDEMAKGTGYFEATDEREAYYISEDKIYLAGTSEQPLVAMHADEILEEKELPKRYVAFSTCFRREAGSYGKDTKGIFRVHQFDKLEMVILSNKDDSKKEHQLLLSLEEKMMKALDLPYQVINVCSGDLGRPAAAKYDIETWLPSENKYRETHSTSNCTDFQARRLNIRYRDNSGKLNFVHILNGTAFAIGRILIMLMENYQQKDGSILVPKVLQKYLKLKAIK